MPRTSRTTSRARTISSASAAPTRWARCPWPLVVSDSSCHIQRSEILLVLRNAASELEEEKNVRNERRKKQMRLWAWLNCQLRRGGGWNMHICPAFSPTGTNERPQILVKAEIGGQLSKNSYCRGPLKSCSGLRLIEGGWGRKGSMSITTVSSKNRGTGACSDQGNRLTGAY